MDGPDPAMPHPPRPIRIGVVSFLNTLPLIDGLDRLADVELRASVPSGLIGLLLDGTVDVALCSTIDYQQAPEPLVVVPAGLLGCAGPTLTVRLYSAGPLEGISRVYCDTDSHTSVVLMRILLREQYGIDPGLVAYHAREHVAENRPIDGPDAVLLIGDKVVTDCPSAERYPHQLDLGLAWWEMTGLPFVFATWLARRAMDPARLGTAFAVLDRQRRRNRGRIESIIHARAEARGWPRDLAATYLRDYLRFAFDETSREGLDLFFRKAREHGFISHCRDVEMLTGAEPLRAG